MNSIVCWIGQRDPLVYQRTNVSAPKPLLVLQWDDYGSVDDTIQQIAHCLSLNPSKRVLPVFFIK